MILLIYTEIYGLPISTFAECRHRKASCQEPIFLYIQRIASSQVYCVLYNQSIASSQVPISSFLFSNKDAPPHHVPRWWLGSGWAGGGWVCVWGGGYSNMKLVYMCRTGFKKKCVCVGGGVGNGPSLKMGRGAFKTGFWC